MLTESRTDVLGVRRWPTVDHGPEDEIRRHLHSCLVGHNQPTERTAALVSLLLATDSLHGIVNPSDPATKKAIAARARALSDGDWAGAAVKAAIEEVHAGMA